MTPPDAAVAIPHYDPPDVVAPTWTLGDRMRKARETAGYGHTAMAAYFGVHRNQITRWESGRTPPKRHIVVQWALVTRVPLAWLESGQVTHTPPSGEPVEAPRGTKRPASRRPGAQQGQFTRPRGRMPHAAAA